MRSKDGADEPKFDFGYGEPPSLSGKAENANPSSWQNRLLLILAGLALASSGLSLGGCAETELAAQGAKSIQRNSTYSQPSQPRYKVGSPYQVAGVWYKPEENPTYDNVGIASWYGPTFHGKSTANGEIFNQNALTAAHPTLPMPSLVRVTNLDNGRAITVRVNDRGPFAAGREIDLSKRSAELLGFIGKGTTKVRVQYVGRAPLDGDVRVAENVETVPQTAATYAAAPQAAAPITTSTYLAPADSPVTSAPLETIPQPETQVSYLEILARGPVTPAEAATPAPAAVSNIYVQAGAFADPANAERMSKALTDLGQVQISPVNNASGQLYRVQLGPMSDQQTANAALEEMKRRGVMSAKVVTR